MQDDHVIINGKRYNPSPAHVSHSHYVFNKIRFKREEEMWVAEILTHMGIRYLYEVSFPLQGAKSYCPDFILERPFRWVEDQRFNGSLILGIEMKACDVYRKEKWVEKSVALIECHHIPVLVFSRKWLKPYYRAKHLPIKPI